jgi:hypothetical protein
MFIPTREEPGIGHETGPHLSSSRPEVSERSAVIFKPAPSAMTSGRKKTAWVLQFERQTPQYTEPLMGWTSDDDPLASVELDFDTRESATAFARRQGLRYRVQDSDS